MRRADENQYKRIGSRRLKKMETNPRKWRGIRPHLHPRRWLETNLFLAPADARAKGGASASECLKLFNSPVVERLLLAVFNISLTLIEGWNI
jgi:hypothetical protein